MHHTPLSVCAHAIRTCWQSFDKSDGGGPVDMALIDRVGNKLKHASTLEHLVYTFNVKGMSRACLQELARHRMASLSVKSTRYTLKELKSLDDIVSHKGAEKFCVLTGNKVVDDEIVAALMRLQRVVKLGEPNDYVKFVLPEAYKTDLVWTINARSLQNFISLRSSRSALWAIQDLAEGVREALPKEHKFIFKGC